MIRVIVTICISLLLLLSSCRQPSGNTAEVKCSFADANGFKLVLQEMDIREIHSIDSVVPDQSGKFSFLPVINEPGFWLLKAQTGKIMVLLLNAGNEVELSGSILDFPDHVIMKGPNEAMLLNEFFHRTRQNERKVDSLEMLLVERQDSADYYHLTQKLDTSFQQIWESQRDDEISFIDNHPGSLASLVVLNYAFGMSPVLSPEDDFFYFQKLDSALFSNFPGNKHVKFHHKRVEEIRRKISSGK